MEVSRRGGQALILPTNTFASCSCCPTVSTTTLSTSSAGIPCVSTTLPHRKQLERLHTKACTGFRNISSMVLPLFVTGRALLPDEPACCLFLALALSGPSFIDYCGHLRRTPRTRDPRQGTTSVCRAETVRCFQLRRGPRCKPKDVPGLVQQALCRKHDILQAIPEVQSEPQHGRSSTHRIVRIAPRGSEQSDGVVSRHTVLCRQSLWLSFWQRQRQLISRFIRYTPEDIARWKVRDV